jgi:hypothetical protein
MSLSYWSIGGVDFAFGLTTEIGYEELVNGLGLAPGRYELLLDLEWHMRGHDTATTTIIVEKYGGGTGEPNDPYQIWDANHMQAIGADANDWDKHFILMADIDLARFDGKDGRERFNIIGGYWYDRVWVHVPFSGEFDGNNHTIAGFTYDSNDRHEKMGLFGDVDDPNAKIENLGLIDPNIDVPTGTMIGSLVGHLVSGTIEDCYIEDGSVSGDAWVGGLVGFSSGTVSDCYYTGSVNGDSLVGGLVGANWGTVANCYSSGDVTGPVRVGGFVGSNPGTITRCYSKSDVLGMYYVGGLVGSNDGFLPVAGHVYVCGTIVECYSTGSVEGNESVFVDWDFVNVWGIGENQTYPYLRTFSVGDINRDRVVDFRDFAIFALRWLDGSGPGVAIVYPEEGQRLMVGGIPPQTLVSAEASDADGTVVRVEFFVDDAKIGEDSDGSDGWSFLWEDYSLGWHVLKARAWDDEGLSGTSEAVNVEVWIMDPPPP